MAQVTCGRVLQCIANVERRFAGCSINDSWLYVVSVKRTLWFTEEEGPISAEVAHVAAGEPGPSAV